MSDVYLRIGEGIEVRSDEEGLSLWACGKRVPVRVLGASVSECVNVDYAEIHIEIAHRGTAKDAENVHVSRDIDGPTEEWTKKHGWPKTLPSQFKRWGAAPCWRPIVSDLGNAALFSDDGWEIVRVDSAGHVYDRPVVLDGWPKP